MKKVWEVIVPVRYRGDQVWIIEANDESEALAGVKSGKGVIDDKEITVTSIDYSKVKIKEIER